MNILFMTGREISYMRNKVLLRAFRRIGTVDIVGVDNRPSSLAVNSVRVAVQSLPRLLTTRYDLVFVGFYGQVLMQLIAPFGRAPILFDAFISTYDTLCYDRSVVEPHSVPGRFAYWLDASSCRRATHVLIDTPQHADYFATTFGLTRDRIEAIPVGCNEDTFCPRNVERNSASTTVLHYSSFQPLHGVDTIVAAAALLKHEPIYFRLIGDGPEHTDCRRLAEQRRLTNVTFHPPLPIERIAEEVATADICLAGHFGKTAKASRVIPGKLYQMLAMQRAIIASDTGANRDLLAHGETAYLVPPADAHALAGAIRRLHQDSATRRRIATRGRELYEQCCSEAKITEQLHDIVQHLVC